MPSIDLRFDATNPSHTDASLLLRVMMTLQADTAPGYALLVDADDDAARIVREALEGTGLELRSAKTVQQALQSIEREPPRLILSELSLPDGSGFALCRLMRESAQHSEIPFAILSHWTREADRILAFECGVDDFLSKPYFRRELSSRIRAVLRRSSSSDERAEAPASVATNPLQIDEDRREVLSAGVRVALTPREFALLATLARHRGRVLGRADLIAEAWRPGEAPTERSVDAHVKSLRRKLGAAKDVIETVRGLGYRYADHAQMRPRG